MLIRKWHLSALPFKRFFSNQLNRDTDAHSRDSITSFTFLAGSYGVLPIAILIILGLALSQILQQAIHDMNY